MTILYLVTEDWYFWSHRLPFARAARESGYRVVVATRVTDHGARIRDEGFVLRPLSWRRRGVHPWGELRAVREIIRVYREEQPDLVHHVALKPSLYGSIAAWAARVPAVVNALTGLGYVFLSGAAKARLARPFVGAALGRLFRRPNSRLIVQNPVDLERLVGAGIVDAEHAVLIRGSGVDTERLRPAPEPKGPPEGPIIVALVARMLKDKGVNELVEAARILKREGHGEGQGQVLRVLLAGAPDPENPTSIPEERLRAWHREGVVEWLGPVADVAALWAGAHIAVLPSHYEGLPKSLLEAAACGRPMVAADVSGCREIVREGETGFLVPVGDAPALARAIRRLAADPDLRRRLGRAARRRVEESYAESVVVAETLALYRSLIEGMPRRT
jgi:glycosyltransferase involved in cell wall biosynthesis